MARHTATTASASSTRERNIAGFEITKVVREYVGIQASEFGGSFGQLLDSRLKAAALACEEIQAITLNMEQEDWNEFASHIREQESY